AQTQSAAACRHPATPAEELTCPGILAGSSGPRAVDCSSEVPFHPVDDEMSRPVHGPSDLTPEWLRAPPRRPWRDPRILQFVRPPLLGGRHHLPRGPLGRPVRVVREDLPGAPGTAARLVLAPARPARGIRCLIGSRPALSDA